MIYVNFLLSVNGDDLGLNNHCLSEFRYVGTIISLVVYVSVSWYSYSIISIPHLIDTLKFDQIHNNSSFFTHF